MPDIYEVQAPDGSTLEIQSNGPPTADMAKRAIRAYGDVQAAAAQKKAGAGSTFGSQMTPTNLLHDAGTVAGAGWDVLKTLVKEGWKNPLGINQPDIRLSPERLAEIQREGIAGAFKTGPSLPPSLSVLRTRPTTANPIGILQEAGVTPDMAAHAGGTVAALGAVGATLPNAGQLTTSGGNLVTRAGQAMNPAVTKTLGEGVGALAEAGLGGATGNPMGGLGRVFAGSKIGGAIGEAVPAMTRGTGRLITKAGQFMGSAAGTPAGPTPPPVDVKAAAEQMGLSPSPTGATMESMPNTPAPPAARMPIPVEPAAQAAAQAEAAAAAQAARGAQAAELGVSPTATGATMKSLPETPTPGGGRTAMTPNPEVQAAGAAADAAARRAELMQQLGVGEKPPLLAEAPEPTAVSGEAREPIPVPVKSEPPPIPPAARSNTVLPAKDLGQILREVQQQLSEEPVTTASGSPPQTVTAGGKPAVTQAEYDALQARIPENAARATDPLPPPAGETEAQAVRGETAVVSATPRRALIGEMMQTPSGQVGKVTGINSEGTAQLTIGNGRLITEHQDNLVRPGAAAAVETEAPLPTQSVVPPPTVESEPRLPFEGEGESTIPSREQMSADELSRAREGGRDDPNRPKGETLEDYRLRTRARATGEKSAEPSIIPARRAGAIDDTIESMYERNATDQEFRDYLAKSKNHPKNGEIAAKIESKAHSYKRASPLAHVIVGAAAGGAMLRNALVGKLQGDQKEQD